MWILSGTAGVLPLQADDKSLEGFSTVFSVPPFKQGESVIGIDGWEACGPLTKQAGQDPEKAPVIVTLPNDNSKTALFIPSWGIEKRFQEKLLGRSRITVVLSVLPGRGQIAFHPVFGFRLYMSFGYDGSGVYYNIPAAPDAGVEIPRRETLVPAKEFAEGESLTIVLELDFDALTFAMRVNGKSVDGSPIDVSVKDLSLSPQIDPRNFNLAGIVVAGAGQIEGHAVFLESLSLRPNN